MFITSTLASIMLAIPVMSETPSLEPCAENPPGATPAQLLCLREACKAYRQAQIDCNGDAGCLNDASMVYASEYAACILSVRTHKWATIWYADGEYGVAFDLWDVPEHATRFGF